MRSPFFIISFSFVVLCAAEPVQSLDQIDFFSTREQKNQRAPRFSRPAKNNQAKARIVFFIDPGCHLCPEQASKLQTELTKMGWKYEIEGIFVGNPTQVGKYLAELRAYPFNFELGLDMDGKIAKQYGVNTFPTAVIEVDGKRVVVTRASELSEKPR